jgi:hypothetical protein
LFVTVLPDMAAPLPSGLRIAAFEVGYVCGDGVEHRVPLAEALAVPFEQGLPVRRFTSKQGQRHLSGLWWSATTGGHVGFESWLERGFGPRFEADVGVHGRRVIQPGEAPLPAERRERPHRSHPVERDIPQLSKRSAASTADALGELNLKGANSLEHRC